MRWRTLEKQGGIPCSSSLWYCGGYLDSVFCTAISRVRDEHGAVEKTLTSTLTICTVLVIPVVVVLS